MARAELFEHFFGGYILSGLGAFGPFVNLQLVEKYFAHLFGRRKVETLACKGKDFLFQFVHAQGEQLGCLAQRFGIDTHAGEFHGCEHAHERHFHFFEQLNCVVAHELVVKCVLEPQCYVGVLACVLVDVAGWEVAHVFLLLALRAYEFFDFYGRVTEVLLGERVHGRFGAEFPIRFDLLDTMGGQNLSLQVHPLTEYIYEKFGMPYTQDESYYLLDADEDEETYVYLGLKEGVDKKEMERELRAAEKGEERFPVEKYVNKIPVKKHDHVLIPAGTVHCSGKNTMVLEISATPYIFTFKLWDWGRLGMDGLPRPIHLDHGMKNIQWNRDTKWVYDNIVGQTRTMEKTENCEVERTGLHSREFIDTIRYTLSGPHTVSMDDTVHVMNLVEGRSARIESMDGSFAAFTVHYAETAIVPAAVGTYRIVPEEGEMIRMLVASVR